MPSPAPQPDGWTDAHCHLQEFEADSRLQPVLERARSFHIHHFLVNSTSPADWDRVARLAATPGLHPQFGLHPWFARPPGDWEPALAALLLQYPRAGIGEIGLDRKLTDTPYPLQRQTLQRQLRLAQTLHRPCTLHAVGNVWDDLLHDVRACTPPALLLHAWGGGTRHLPHWLELGALFSFGGALLRTPPSAKLENTLRAIPPEHILIETDSPWQHPLGPGHQSEPALLPAIAARIARIKNIPLETLRQHTHENARRFLSAAART